MILRRHALFVNVVIQGRYRAHSSAVDSRRGYSVVNATRFQQIEHYRNPSQQLLPPDTGDGYIWRMHSIARYQERDGGVYLEVEAMALTRDIPASLRWLVTPVVNQVSISSITTTLSQTRQAASAKRGDTRYGPPGNARTELRPLFERFTLAG